MKLERIHIECEFPNVFPKEQPGLPPLREIGFKIELISSGQPISKAPYKMDSIEFKELRTQLDELLQKRFIRPSVST